MQGTADSLSVLAPAKINLGLVVESPRNDGYHNIRTVFQAVDLADRITVSPAPPGHITLAVTGNDALTPGEDNLVIKAARALARATGCDQGARIQLEKQIPLGAGLGGGSSDAAATLVALNTLWELKKDPALLQRLAASLGSDIPFFLRGGTALGTGRGEILTPLPSMPNWGIVLALSPIQVPTSTAYSMAGKGLTGSSRRFRLMKSALADENFTGVSGHLVNDLEEGVLSFRPDLSGMRRRLQEQVAAQGFEHVGIAMSGSGSTYYLLFSSLRDAEKFSRFSEDLPGVQGSPNRQDAPARLFAVRPLAGGVRILDLDS